MIKNVVFFFFLMISNGNFFAQTITGNFSQLANQEIILERFNGFKTDAINHTTADAKGKFILNYSISDRGVGYLMAADHKPFLVILSGEDIEIQGEMLSNTESIKVTKGQENKWFESYAKDHPKREQALSAWDYLEKLYQTDSLFSKQKSPHLAIQREKKRLDAEDAAYLNQLPKESYVSWFLPARKLISSVSGVAQYRTGEIPATVAAFRNLNYTDPRLYRSGLLKDALDSHFWLLENSGKTLESGSKEMKLSVDALYKNAGKDGQNLNEITNYLFDLFERKSFSEAAEYLAIKVLAENSFPLDPNLKDKLEMYRAMKNGNIASEIQFDAAVLAPGYDRNYLPKNLSDLKSKYTIVVFGAGWCPKCTEEIPEIASFYPKWKQKGFEVVFVSLDMNKDDFENFAKPFPFISISDFKKWEGNAVKDYHVFATPTMYILNSERQIILKPISAKQIDAWIDLH